MGRKAKTQEEKAVKICVTLDKETAEKLAQFAKSEVLPVSTIVRRILTRYFDMK